MSVFPKTGGTVSFEPHPASDPFPRPIRILIVDGHVMFEQGLARVLADEPDLLPVAAARTIEAAASLARDMEPDLVLIDVELPGEDAIAGIGRLRDAAPGVGVLVLGATDDPDLLVAAIRAGARASISTRWSVERLITIVRQAATGGRVPTGEEADVGPAGRGPSPREEAAVGRGFAHLTPRELETLAALAAGSSTAMTAATLHISPLTVRSHVKSILHKLRVHSKLEAVTFAIRNGLIDLDRSA